MATASQARAEKREWLNLAPGITMNPDRRYGVQCVDAVDQYAQDLTGVPWQQSVGGVEGAMQLLDRAPARYWHKIRNDPNDPAQLPDLGDVLVYSGTGNNRASLTYYGHTALTVIADRHGVDVVQQDGAAPPLVQTPDGLYSAKPAHRSRLPYASPVFGTLVGWLRLRDEVVKYTGADKRLSTPAPAAAATAAVPASGVHVVAPGETLGAIAARYRTTVAAIRARNAYIKNPDYLNVGDRITLPAAGARVPVHVVAPGETLGAIAARYGTSVAAIRARNAYIKNPDYLNVGDRITLP